MALWVYRATLFLLLVLPPCDLDLSEAQFTLGVLNGSLSVTVRSRSSSTIDVWLMKDYGNNESWTKELEISSDMLGSPSFLRVLKLPEEGQVLLLNGSRLQTYTPAARNIITVEVDGIQSLVDECVHIPSFISLRGVTGEVMVLTIGSALWRSIGDSEPYLIMNANYGVYLNGVLHWFSMPNVGDYCCMMVCCFDVESKRFQELPLPPLQLTHGSEWDFGVLKDCLCMTLSNDHSIRVWVMKEYGVAESCTLEFDIAVAFDASLPDTQVLKLTDKGDIFLLHQGQLMAYTPGKGVVEVVEVDELPSLDRGFLHIPSFVSPKQIMPPDMEIN